MYEEMEDMMARFSAEELSEEAETKEAEAKRLREEATAAPTDPAKDEAAKEAEAEAEKAKAEAKKAETRPDRQSDGVIEHIATPQTAIEAMGTNDYPFGDHQQIKQLNEEYFSSQQQTNIQEVNSGNSGISAVERPPSVMSSTQEVPKPLGLESNGTAEVPKSMEKKYVNEIKK